VARERRRWRERILATRSGGRGIVEAHRMYVGVHRPSSMPGRMLKATSVTLLAGILGMPAVTSAGSFWPPLADHPVGMRACEVQEQLQPIYSMELRGTAGIRLNLRKTDETHQYVLVVRTDGPKPCDGVVASVMPLPVLAQIGPSSPETPHWYIEFECRYLGRHWSADEPAIGIVDGQLPEGYFLPHSAWRLNVSDLTFEPVASDLVVCARFFDSGG
jgi:hypothetical protein